MYLVGTAANIAGPGTGLVQRIDWTQADEARGLSCGGNCGCKKCGGLGLFDSGTDYSGWGIPEWGVVGVGLYMLLSTVLTTGRAITRVRAMPGERRKRRASEYRQKAKELSRKRR